MDSRLSQTEGSDEHICSKEQKIFARVCVGDY